MECKVSLHSELLGLEFKLTLNERYLFKVTLNSNYSNGGKITIRNTAGQKPKTFEIDFLNGNDAVELKWRDATTDGDHILKEHTRVKVIKEHGYKPIRVMFYYPQREQARKIQ